MKPGEWTDDTSMALCLAESLIEAKGFDPLDQMQRYCRWKNEGYLSSNGQCFDIGATVGDALRRFELTGDPVSGSVDPYSAGNGSLMRLAPVPLFYARNPRAAIEYAAESSRTTHGAQEAVDACRYFAALIVGALQVHSQCSPCLRGDKSAENHFTTETRRTLRTQWDVKLGHHLPDVCHCESFTGCLHLYPGSPRGYWPHATASRDAGPDRQ